MTLQDCLRFVGEAEREQYAKFDAPEFYTRKPDTHMTVSAFIVDETFRKVLFVYHLGYRSYSWIGGHSDGETDFLALARRETEEETGLTKFTLFSSEPLSIDFLPVKAHLRRGEPIAAHTHLNVALGFLASESERTRIKEDENSDVRWIPISEIERYCEEAHMLPVYRRCANAFFRILRKKREAFAALPDRLLPWYREHRRSLPWREDPSPYRVLVSEIMLQQTRVEAGKRYFERFIAELPTVQALAECPEEKLMKLWEGLGYYNRARNLQRAAKQIAERGEFPESAAELRALPGVGAYTAGAIASIAFGAKEPAVDGNVVRILSRIVGDYRPDPRREMADALRQIYPDAAGDFTQSLMELGALVCLPNGRPLCADCPMADLCRAKETGSIDLLPVPIPKQERKRVRLYVWCIETPRGLALRKRVEPGVLHGMWEFPTTETAELPAAFGAEASEIVGVKRHTHVFTHLEWEMTCFFVRAASTALPCYERETIERELSLPSAFRWILRELPN